METELKEKQTAQPITLRTAYTNILDYQYYLNTTDYAKSTKSLIISIILSFHKSQNITIPQIRIKKHLCKEENYERPLTKDEIRQMLNVCPLRERAFITLQAMTGMASKEARTLTIKKLITIINEELKTQYTTVTDLIENKKTILKHKAYKITIIREKVEYRYITFIPYTAIEAILQYLNWRLNIHSPQQITNNEQGLVFVTTRGTPMNSKAVTGMFREIGRKAGFTNQYNTYRTWRSHNLRKYFYNIAEEHAGYEYANEWLGHVPSATTRAYARREDRMKEAYLKTLPYLLFEKEKYGDELGREIETLQNKLNSLLNRYD